MVIKNITFAGETHIGLKRTNNEDKFLIKELRDLTILVVADGVGGNPGGEIASGILADTIRDADFSGENIASELTLVLNAAQNRITDIARKKDMEGMGTTATIVILCQNQVDWIHVGDSRFYCLRKGVLQQITTDHTFIQDLIDDGTLTLETAKKHPLKNMLDQCLGCEEIEPESGELHVEKGDRLLLTSDGLTDLVPDHRIASLLNTNSTVQESVQNLIQAALRNHREDEAREEMNLTSVRVTGINLFNWLT